MRANVLGVKRVKGDAAKQSGLPFDMCRLFVVVPIELANNAKVQVSGHGFEIAEIELDPAALSRFDGLKFPLMLDLTTDARPFRGKLETVVTGFAAIAAARAA